LDVVDPEVSTLGYLSNIQNSIFVPHIPSLYSRRSTHDLPDPRAGYRRGSRAGLAVEAQSTDSRTRAGSLRSRLSGDSRRGSLAASQTGLSGAMDEEERSALDEHVRDLLTRRAKFRRGLRGFWAFVKTPIGFIMTLYGFLVTFWGCAIVLFILGWINVGSRRRYWIEICDQILCALFAAVGLGFAPFRAVDTYRMIHIAHYHHLTWRRRREMFLPQLVDPNDLPRPAQDGRNLAIIPEDLPSPRNVVVLTPEEQKILEHHQRAFHASHTFYRFHETSTHRAFPLDLMIVIVCLLDCHSMLQAALGGITWGIKYTHRPTVLTATIISCSLSCNAVAGIIIWLGGRRTKKKEEVERRLRIALEKEAYSVMTSKGAAGAEEAAKDIAAAHSSSGDARLAAPAKKHKHEHDLEEKLDSFEMKATGSSQSALLDHDHQGPPVSPTGNKQLPSTSPSSRDQANDSTQSTRLKQTPEPAAGEVNQPLIEAAVSLPQAFL
ncbi:hypothetical protein IE81DRAFT_290894, partial [Ceraceosorus guamensis]